MKPVKYTKYTLLIAFTIMSLALLQTAIAEDAENVRGLINIDPPQAGEAKIAAKVEFNLSGSLLSVAGASINKQDPGIGELLAGIDVVKVRIYSRESLAGISDDDIIKFYENQLKKDKWDNMARVNDPKSRIGIHVLPDKDYIAGLLVIVLNQKDFIVVNLAGKINPEKIAEMAKKTGFDMSKFEHGALMPHPPMPPSPEQEKNKEESKRGTIENFLNGNMDDAILSLKSSESDSRMDNTDYALMAMIYQSKGELDRSYYYLGRLYESQGFKNISAAFYKKAVEINPQSEAQERLDVK